MPMPANITEATSPNSKRASDPQSGAEARCMSYAIEALRSRPQARFTKARRRCRNSTLPSYNPVHNFLLFKAASSQVYSGGFDTLMPHEISE